MMTQALDRSISPKRNWTKTKEVSMCQRAERLARTHSKVIGNTRDWRRGFDGEAPVAHEQPEPFVDADTVAAFLALRPRRILELARVGCLPAHPIGLGARRTWRFLLSEVATAVERASVGPAPTGNLLPTGRRRS
jgi:hypothetical protein